MSYALNYAGFEINETTGTAQGAKGLNYFYKVEYMGPYLMNTYNFTELTSGNNYRCFNHTNKLWLERCFRSH